MVFRHVLRFSLVIRLYLVTIHVIIINAFLGKLEEGKKLHSYFSRSTLISSTAKKGQ